MQDTLPRRGTAIGLRNTRSKDSPNKRRRKAARALREEHLILAKLAATPGTDPFELFAKQNDWKRRNDALRAEVEQVAAAAAAAADTHDADVEPTVLAMVETRVDRRDRERRERRHTARQTSSGDSGDPDESEPPSTGRPCAAPWCSHLVYGPPRKVYCGRERCNRARAEERQRKHRHGDLSELERQQLAAARRAGMVGGNAFAAGILAVRKNFRGKPEPAAHSLSFLWKFGLMAGDDPGELEAIRSARVCRCNGHHIDGGAVGCFKCGLSREAAVSCS